MKKSFKRVISLLLCVACTTMALASPVYAATVKTSGYTTISPTNAQFESAASPKYFNESETIAESITSSYDMNITHYEAPASGFYSIYTIGKTDTVGKVFEQQNILWITTDYEEIGYDDDDGDASNYKMIVELDKYEDYYICSRGYLTKTGSYNLRITPNLDQLQSTTGGKWVNDHVSMEYISTGGSTVVSKTYFNKEQVEVYYGMMYQDVARQKIANAYSLSGINGAIAKIKTLLNMTISVIDWGDIGNAVVSGVSFVTSAFEVMMDIASGGESSEYIARRIKEACMVQDRLVNGTIDFYSPYGLCITSTVQEIHSEMYDYMKYEDEYEKYSLNMLLGELYEEGHWE